jgi:hypothetical protein
MIAYLNAGNEELTHAQPPTNTRFKNRLKHPLRAIKSHPSESFC